MKGGFRKSVTAVIFLGMIGIFVALMIPKAMKMRSLDERRQDLSREIQKVELENKRMEQEFRLLKDDPVYLEKVAREKFNKAKEGEIVYKVVRPGDSVKD